MSKKIQTNQYQKLFNDISAIYEESMGQVNQVLNKARWDIGRRIVEEEQNGLTRAPYGEELIVGIAKDMTEKYGSGFSKTNLEYMRKYYTLYPKTQPAGQLDWTKWTLLLSIENDKYRRELYEKALKERLSREQMRLLISKNKPTAIIASHESTNIKPVSLYTLDYTRGKLYAYLLRAPKLKTPLHTGLDSDLGFKIHRPLDRQIVSRFADKQIIRVEKKDGNYSYLSSDVTKREAFTYRAYIEKVTDGDTLLLYIDLGFGITTRQHVRLAGFNAPEMDTKEGQAAKRNLQRILNQVDFVIVKTFSHDQYGRFLANIYYLPGESDPHVVAEKGIFLNEQIVKSFGY